MKNRTFQTKEQQNNFKQKKLNSIVCDVGHWEKQIIKRNNYFYAWLAKTLEDTNE